MAAKKLPLKERYVVENGIPTIRTLHRHSKLPLATIKEQDEAYAKYMAARRLIDMGDMDEKLAMVEFEIDFSVNPETGEIRK